MVNYCFALPYVQRGLELAKKFAQENTNTKEHDEFYKIADIIRENIWIQRSPPGSGAPDLEVVSIETNDEVSASNGRPFSVSCPIDCK